MADRDKAETAYKNRIGDLTEQNKTLLEEQKRAEVVIKQRNGSMQKELHDLKSLWAQELGKLSKENTLLKKDNTSLLEQIAESKQML